MKRLLQIHLALALFCLPFLSIDMADDTVVGHDVEPFSPGRRAGLVFLTLSLSYAVLCLVLIFSA